jgi:hypothetical protein
MELGVLGISCTLRSHSQCSSNWPTTSLAKMLRYLWYCSKTCSSIVGSLLVVIVMVMVMAIIGSGFLASRMRAFAYSLVSPASAFLSSLRRLVGKLRTSVMVAWMVGFLGVEEISPYQ